MVGATRIPPDERARLADQLYLRASRDAARGEPGFLREVDAFGQAEFTQGYGRGILLGGAIGLGAGILVAGLYSGLKSLRKAT